MYPVLCLKKAIMYWLITMPATSSCTKSCRNCRHLTGWPTARGKRCTGRKSVASSLPLIPSQVLSTGTKQLFLKLFKTLNISDNENKTTDLTGLLLYSDHFFCAKRDQR